MTVEHIEVLVEEQSMARAMGHLLPAILGDRVTYEVRTFNGKQSLLRKLPSRLRGYANWVGETKRVIVILDRDGDDCVELKEKLDGFAAEAGMSTVSVTGSRPGQVINRLAIEELEAWYLGDVAALRAAYPRVPSSLGERAKFRDPDAVKGGTAEALERVLKDAKYHQAGLEKLALADAVGPHMTLDGNRSRSFQKFVDGVRFLMDGAR
ncbi:MAG: DUF4276 family protein [Dermatophilaceae bacterium]